MGVKRQQLERRTHKQSKSKQTKPNQIKPKQTFSGEISEINSGTLPGFQKEMPDDTFTLHDHDRDHQPLRSKINHTAGYK